MTDLIFSSEQILSRPMGLTFDDVLLVPQFSDIASRKIPKLNSQLTKHFATQIPLITANMDTITETEMALAMAKMGGIGSIHRFMTISDQVAMIKALVNAQNLAKIDAPIAASVGVKEEGIDRAHALIEAGVKIITLDIAHGDSIMMYDTLNAIKSKYGSKIDVIAGNVATSDGVARMIDAGADAIKVGIGPGSMCTTRIITGHGVPQLTAIAMAVKIAGPRGIPVIADGGIKNSGDIVKALAAGAQSVMIGSLVSGTLETPGELKHGMKEYRGMASKKAQVSWRGEIPQGMAAEGESTLIPCKGPVQNIIDELLGGLRSGMTYMGVASIEEMPKKAQFISMSAAGLGESRPHGVV